MPEAGPGDSGCALGFDYGTRLIGVAVGSPLGHGARAVATIDTGDWASLDALVAEWRPARLVVGLPLALDGGEQKMSRAAREFARMLERRYALGVDLVDERHSSGEAARRFAERRAQGAARRKDAARIDALAAAVILDDWLTQRARAN